MNTADQATAAPSTRFRKKTVVVDAITFDELVTYGKATGAPLTNGMPWSFTYKGHPITHENDDCYLIPTLEGSMKMGRTDMLITGVKGEIYPCKMEIFAATYEPAAPAIPPAADDINGNVIADKHLRVGLDLQLQLLKKLPASRERANSITRLQEAIMWLGMDLKRLNDTRPYPSSYDPTNAKVEPTADGLTL